MAYYYTENDDGSEVIRYRDDDTGATRRVGEGDAQAVADWKRSQGYYAPSDVYDMAINVGGHEYIPSFQTTGRGVQLTPWQGFNPSETYANYGDITSKFGSNPFIEGPGGLAYAPRQMLDAIGRSTETSTGIGGFLNSGMPVQLLMSAFTGGAMGGFGNPAMGLKSAFSGAFPGISSTLNSFSPIMDVVGKITNPLGTLGEIIGGGNPFSSLTNLFTGGAPGVGGAPASAGGGVMDESFFGDNYSDYWNSSDYGQNTGWGSTLGDEYGNYDISGGQIQIPPFAQNIGTGTGSILEQIMGGLKGAGSSILGSIFGNGGTGTGSGGDWGSILNRIMSGVGGIFDLASHSPLSARGITERASMLADPAQKMRPIYGGMLHQYLTEPGSYSLSPAAQFQLDTGTENLTRSMAAKGLLGSGNILGEIMKYGEGVASQDYWKAVENMGRLSGGLGGEMGTAGKIAQGYYDQRTNALGGIGRAVGGGTNPSSTGTGDILRTIGGLGNIFKSLAA